MSQDRYVYVIYKLNLYGDTKCIKAFADEHTALEELEYLIHNSKNHKTRFFYVEVPLVL
jgi:hypothetical protein